MRSIPIVAVLIWCLIWSLAAVGPASAQGFTDGERGLLLTLLPGSDKIWAADQGLIGSAADIARAADRIASAQTCAVDRELIGLGAALQGTADALKLMEPMLLKQAPPIGTLANPTPAETSAWQAYFRHREEFRSALDRLARAGGSLATLDASGSTGPPAEAGPLIQNAGQSLIAIDEQSGIGLHLQLLGRAVEALRTAAQQFDQRACARAARLIAQAVELTGASLRLSAAIVWQSGAAHAVAVALYDMSRQMPTPPFGKLDDALALVGKGIRQQAQALRRLSEIAQALDASGESAGLVAKYRAAGPILARRAADQEALAARIAEARVPLARPGAGANAASVMRSVGRALVGATPFAVLKAAGEALDRAGVSLNDGQRDAASMALEQGAKTILLERSLILVTR